MALRLQGVNESRFWPKGNGMNWVKIFSELPSLSVSHLRRPFLPSCSLPFFCSLIRSDNRVNHAGADKRDGQMAADLPPLKLCPRGTRYGIVEAVKYAQGSSLFQISVASVAKKISPSKPKGALWQITTNRKMTFVSQPFQYSIIKCSSQKGQSSCKHFRATQAN